MKSVRAGKNMKPAEDSLKENRSDQLADSRLGILAGGINEKSVEEFSTFVKTNVPTAGNMRGSAEYRSHLAGVLAGRALQNINRD